MEKVIKLIICTCWFRIVYIFFEIDILILFLLKAVNNHEIYFIKNTGIFKNKHRKKHEFIVISPC